MDALIIATPRSDLHSDLALDFIEKLLVDLDYDLNCDPEKLKSEVGVEGIRHSRKLRATLSDGCPGQEMCVCCFADSLYAEPCVKLD